MRMLRYDAVGGRETTLSVGVALANIKIPGQKLVTSLVIVNPCALK